jgi:thiaminase/transcriptional activator TenA
MQNEAGFSSAAWSRNSVRYGVIRDMPFNTELAKGSLPMDVFRGYMLQDAHYLVAFGQALAIAAAKSDGPDDIVRFARAAETAIVVERDLHGTYFNLFGVTPEDAARTPLTPACHHYRSFLIATAFREPLPVVAAGLLPCFWIYAEIGKHVHGMAAPDNPYRAWIDTYAGEEFDAAVRDMIGAVDRLAEDAGAPVLAAMHEAYDTATRLEFMFWDSAWRRETWPL